MTIDEAIATLNSQRYEGCDAWRPAAQDGRPVVAGARRFLTLFEAIVMADALIRTDQRFRPWTPPTVSFKR